MRATTIAVPPDVHARISALVARSARHGVGCAHLEPSAVAIACLMHPSTLRCVACSAKHIASHSHVEEHGCDGCDGPLDDDEFVAMVQPFEVDTTVSIGRGRRAAVGVVYVIGYGLCAACSARAVAA